MARTLASGLVALTLVTRLWPASSVDWGTPAADPSPTATISPTAVEATVTRVIDGSSLDAYVAGRRTAVGYLGIETPNRHEFCGQEAMVRNHELAGTAVLLEDDPSHQFDAIGRRLYYAYTLDGQSIEEILLREGLARAARTDAARGPGLAELQAEAEAGGLGCLWSGGR